MITRDEAKKKIEQIVLNGKPIKTGATLPIKKGEQFNVYKIPIEYLVPNIKNDRITWKIMEFEADQNRSLDINNDADIEFIYKIINSEHEKENKKTKEDIAKKGQQIDGVITNNGIIIDGNRRVTLLRALFKGEADNYGQNVEDFRYFNTIVLPGNIDQKEIMALETMLQIGTDEKVNYNRICLYIKVNNLINAGYTYKSIKQYMNLKKEKEVEDMLKIYKLMLDYLNQISKPNHFTLLDGLEDQFINTKTIFKALDNGTYSANWEYSEDDVSEFKTVCYDYMRSKFEGKKYRDVLLGQVQKTNGIFIEKNVWEAFLCNHNNIIEKNGPSSEDDWKFLGRKRGQLEQNLNNASSQLKEVIKNKSLKNIIQEIKIKVDRLKDILDNMEEIMPEDLLDLKQLSSDIYNIYNKFD